MNEIAVAFIGLSGTILIALLGLYGAKKYNIGPSQDKLVDTLKDLAEGRGDQIEDLKEANKRIPFLESELMRVNAVVFNQVVKIQDLELQLEQERAKKE